MNGYTGIMSQEGHGVKVSMALSILMLMVKLLRMAKVTARNVTLMMTKYLVDLS